ncbi:hypothetical protein [Pandoraea soli]
MSNPLLTDDDLKGFDLKKYADLEHFSYKQWCDLIQHRSLLWDIAKTWKDIFRPGTDPFALHREVARHRADEQGLSDAWKAAESRFSPEAMQASAKAIVTAVLGSPLHQAFALPPYLEGENPLATASIRLRPQPYAGSAPLEPDEFNAALFGALDDVPLAQAYESAERPRRILLEVDIDAPNDQLVADFRRWLTLWRQLTQGNGIGIGRKLVFPDWINTSINRWLRDKLLAYIDLKLASKFLRRDFQMGTLAERLGFDEGEWDSAEARLENYVQEFFSPKISDWMYFLSFDEERRVGARKAT